MADIELVIKIPKEVWNKAKEYGHLDICGVELSERVMNGIPLPKEHGKLIDVSELLSVTDIDIRGSEVTYVLYDDIENAPTIVEEAE